MKQFLTRFINGKKEQITTIHTPDAQLINQERDLVNLVPEVRYQSIIGFGGAFTDTAGAVFSQMPKHLQKELISDYFSPDGLGYTLGRTSIDSCDFSLERYASDDVACDVDLHHFNTTRAQKYVIPMLTMAQQTAGKPIGLMVTPWSPPAWMKTNHSRIGGGELKPEYYAVWAEYICRFIRSYTEAGAEITMLSCQNEPKAIQAWDSCIMSAEQEGFFIEKYIYPALKKHKLDNVRILIWDHNKERALERVCATLESEEVRSMVSGVAVHWYSGDHFEALQMIHEKFPDLVMVFTEACIEYSRYGKDNQLHDAEMYAHDIIGNFTHGLNAFIDWNLLVDQNGGPNNVGNNCAAPVMYDTKNSTLHRNLSFDYLGHFSKHIKPGAVRIGMSRFDERLEVFAAENADGSIVATVLNRCDEDIPFSLRCKTLIWPVSQPAHSISTYIEPSRKNGQESQCKTAAMR